MRDVHDARQRAALLAGDDVLTTQYREMVDGGVVTEEVGSISMPCPPLLLLFLLRGFCIVERMR